MDVKDWSYKPPRNSFIGNTSQLCAKCVTGKNVGLCSKCQAALVKQKRMAYGSGRGPRGSNESLLNRIDKLLIEVTVVGGSYIDGTVTNVTGSGQTRAGAEERNVLTQMQQKNPYNKVPVKFSNLLGAYVPKDHQPDEKEDRWSMDK